MALEDGGYIFGGGTGLTYEQLKQRRAIATALATRNKGFPKNVGEGLTYLGDSFAEAMQTLGLNRSEADYTKRQGAALGTLRPPGTATTTTPAPQSTLAVPRADVNIEPVKPTQVVADQPKVETPAETPTLPSISSDAMPSGMDIAGDIAPAPAPAPSPVAVTTPPVAPPVVPPPAPADVGESWDPNAPATAEKPPAAAPAAPLAKQSLLSPVPSQRDKITLAMMSGGTSAGDAATAPIAGPVGAPVAGPVANKPLAPGDARSTAYSMDDQGNLVPADTGAQTPPEQPAQTPPGAPAQAPAAFSPRRVAAIDANPTVKDAIERAAAAHGIDPSLLKVIAHIESSGIPGAGANTGSYKGLFQLSNGEFKNNGGGDIYNPYDNANAAAAKIAAEGAAFKAQTGQDPTPLQLYMIHQQGLGGTISHLQDPSQPAWQAMLRTGEGQQKGEGWAKRAIWGNIPDDLKGQFGNVNNVTSADLFNIYQAKLGGGAGGSAGNFSVAAGGPARPVGAGGDYTTARASGGDAGGGDVADTDTRDAITMALLSQNGQQTPPQQPEDAAPDRLRDVLGLANRSTLPQRPTASLGRTGVTADTSLPVLAPMGGLGGANVSTAPPTTPPASDPSQRDAVTQALLSQSADVPLADPTGAGAIAPIAGGPGAGAPAPAPAPTAVTPAQSPTIADITPAPIGGPGAQLAQAAPAAPPAQAAPPAIPGPLAPPVPRPPTPMQQQPETPPQFSQPPVMPKPPPIPPPSAAELNAQRVMSQFPDDPVIQARAQKALEDAKAERLLPYQRDVEQYKADMQRFNAEYGAWQAQQRQQPKEDLELRTKRQELADKEAAARRSEALGGVDPKFLEGEIVKSADNVKALAASQQGLQNARSSLNDNMFTGSTAEIQLNLAKWAHAAGLPLDPRVPPTEAFRAYMANVTAQARQALVGGAQISNADLKAAERASAGDITYEPGSIRKVLDSLERINTATAIFHQGKLLAYAGNDPNAQRAVFGTFGLPMENIVPTNIQNVLKANPTPEAIADFDRTFNTPGLANKILTRR